MGTCSTALISELACGMTACCRGGSSERGRRFGLSWKGRPCVPSRSLTMQPTMVLAADCSLFIRPAAAAGKILKRTSLHHDTATARRGTYLPLIWKPSPAEPVSADVVCSSADVSPGTSSTIPLTRPAHGPHVKNAHQTPAERSMHMPAWHCHPGST